MKSDFLHLCVVQGLSGFPRRKTGRILRAGASVSFVSGVHSGILGFLGFSGQGVSSETTTGHL